MEAVTEVKPRVNKENIKKWVDALRSGKYTQTRERLRGDGNAMCCLGVACDVSGLGTWAAGENKLTGRSDLTYIVEDGERSSEILPIEVGEWLFGDAFANDIWSRRKAKVPLLADSKGEMIESATCNDDLEWSFAAIADAIERTYLTGATE